MSAPALELSIRAAATRSGGGGVDWASITNGLKLTAVDDILDIKDTTTPANNYKGPPNPKFTSVRASAGSYLDSNRVLRFAAVNEIRRDFDPRIPGGVGGYLVENARANFLLHSTGLHITHHITASGGNALPFTDGEVITSVGGGTGTYVLDHSAGSIYAVRNGSGTFSGVLTGGTSGATRNISSFVVIWVATNITAVKNQTGPDGVANSATLLTATGAGATVTQLFTGASTLRAVSAFVKLVSGSGTVEMTVDGGTTWVPVTVTSSWTRVEIPTQTVINPVTGFRIASGVSIAAYCVQMENAGANVPFASSPIVTTTAFATRAIDQPKIAGTSFPLNNTDGQGTLYVKAVCYGSAAQTRMIAALDDGTVSEGVEVLLNSLYRTSFAVRDGGVVQATMNSVAGGGIPPLTPFKLALGLKLNDTFGATSEAATSFPVDTACTMPTPTFLYVGARYNPAGVEMMGWLLELLYLPEKRTNDEISGLVA